MKALAALIVGATSLIVTTSSVSAGSDKVPVVIDVAVKLADGASIADVASATASEAGVTLVAERDLYLVSVEMLVDDPDDPKRQAKAVKDAIKQVEKDDRVKWAVELSDAPVRDDRFHAWPATDQDAASVSDVAGQTAFAPLQLDAVHDVATGEGVVVAVLDTGVERSHPMLAGRVLGGYDFVDGDSDPGEFADGVDNDDDGHIDEAHGHGTFVAGIVAQVAPDATVLPVRVLDADGDGHLYAVIDGIDFAVEQDVDVINLSFGLDMDTGSKALEEAVKRAQKAGIIVVAAAGNAGDEEKRFPASLKGVVSVTALGGGNEFVADFATRGKWVTVAAPGFDIVSSTVGGGYAEWAGTSMAAPVVSAGYALLIETNPNVKSDKIASILLKAARKLSVKNVASEGSLDLLGAVI